MIGLTTLMIMMMMIYIYIYIDIYIYIYEEQVDYHRLHLDVAVNRPAELAVGDGPESEGEKKK